MEEAQRNSIGHALKTAQLHSIFATMRAVESPVTNIARELSNSDALRVSSAIRQHLAERAPEISAFADVARQSSMALRRSLMPWPPVLSELAISANRTANDILAWRERYAPQQGAVIEAMRRLESNIAPVRRLAEQFGEQLHIIAQLSQSAALQSWLSEMSSDDVQERLERLMHEASEDPSASLADVTAAPTEMSVTAASLVSWLLRCLTALRASEMPYADRMVAYSAALAIACFLYTEIGGSQDQAELVARIDAHGQAVSTKFDEQNRSGRQLVALTQAMLDLETVDHTYRVVVHSAPLRTELSEPATYWLPRDEEVQVLRATGKWRFVQTVDDEGTLRLGWVMNKHLERLKEQD